MFGDNFNEQLFSLLLALPAFVGGLALHEFAHAWTAVKFGDDTPRRDGRLTLDPLAHLDPVGSIFFIFMWFSGLGIGWAKPVMVNHRNLQNPRRDSVLVAIAGPISNLIQMVFWLLLLFVWNIITLKSGWGLSGGEYSIHAIINGMVINGVLINLLLAAFNMIPIPPLDGHWVLEGLGPPFVTDFYNTIRPYSFLILIVLVSFTPLLGLALRPVMAFGANLLAWTAMASQTVAALPLPLA